MVVFPNAKINIGLNVVEKRPDDFHNIESVFYPVFDLYDVLEVVENLDNNQVIFTSTGINIPGKEEGNLCVKAYQLITTDYNLPPVKIHLHKVIPIGAGLGGGSSDAAFMIKALDKLFDLNLSIHQMQNYARQLGSDCAFFIENKPVYAFNKGDEFESIDVDLSDYEIKISYPDIHISTVEAYNGIVPNISKYNLRETIIQPIESWKNTIQNDFEASVFPSYPEIKQLKADMYQNGAKYAAMTGSGSAVYGVF